MWWVFDSSALSFPLTFSYHFWPPCLFLCCLFPLHCNISPCSEATLVVWYAVIVASFPVKMSLQTLFRHTEILRQRYSVCWMNDVFESFIDFACVRCCWLIYILTVSLAFVWITSLSFCCFPPSLSLALSVCLSCISFNRLTPSFHFLPLYQLPFFTCFLYSPCP